MTLIDQVIIDSLTAYYLKEANLPSSVEVDGHSYPTTNSRGKAITNTLEGIKNFWRWFKGSLATDLQGRPLVVYHGARGNSNIKVFDPQSHGLNVKGTYFATNRSAAGHWSIKPYTKTWRKPENVIAQANSLKTVDELLDLYNSFVDEDDELKLVSHKINWRICKAPEGYEDADFYRLDSENTSEPVGYLTKDNIYVLLDDEGKIRKEIDLIELLRSKIADLAQSSYDSDFYAVYVKLLQPLVIDAEKQPYWRVEFQGEKVSTEAIADWALHNGYDGVIIYNVYETDYENRLTDDIIIFNSDQVKMGEEFDM